MRVLRISHSAVVDAWRERERALAAPRGRRPAADRSANGTRAVRSCRLEPRGRRAGRGRRHLGIASRSVRSTTRGRCGGRSASRGTSSTSTRSRSPSPPRRSCCCARCGGSEPRMRCTPPRTSTSGCPRRSGGSQRRVLGGAAAVSVCNAAAGEIVERRGFPGRADVIPLGVDVAPLHVRPTRPARGAGPSWAMPGGSPTTRGSTSCSRRWPACPRYGSPSPAQGPAAGCAASARRAVRPGRSGDVPRAARRRRARRVLPGPRRARGALAGRRRRGSSSSAGSRSRPWPPASRSSPATVAPCPTSSARPGCWSRPDDAEALREALDRMSSATSPSPGGCATQGLRSRAECDWEAVADRYVAMYRRVTPRRRPSTVRAAADRGCRGGRRRLRDSPSCSRRPLAPPRRDCPVTVVDNSSSTTRCGGVCSDLGAALPRRRAQPRVRRRGQPRPRAPARPDGRRPAPQPGRRGRLPTTSPALHRALLADPALARSRPPRSTSTGEPPGWAGRSPRRRGTWAGGRRSRPVVGDRAGIRHRLGAAAAVRGAAPGRRVRRAVLPLRGGDRLGLPRRPARLATCRRPLGDGDPRRRRGVEHATPAGAEPTSTRRRSSTCASTTAPPGGRWPAPGSSRGRPCAVRPPAAVDGVRRPRPARVSTCADPLGRDEPSPLAGAVGRPSHDPARVTAWPGPAAVGCLGGRSSSSASCSASAGWSRSSRTSRSSCSPSPCSCSASPSPTRRSSRCWRCPCCWWSSGSAPAASTCRCPTSCSSSRSGPPSSWDSGPTARRCARLLWLAAVYQARTLFTVVNNPYTANAVEWFHAWFLTGGALIVGWALGRAGRAPAALTPAAWLASCVIAVATVAQGVAHLPAASSRSTPQFPFAMHKNFAGTRARLRAPSIAYVHPPWMRWPRLAGPRAFVLCYRGHALHPVAAGDHRTRRRRRRRRPAERRDPASRSKLRRPRRRRRGSPSSPPSSATRSTPATSSTRCSSGSTGSRTPSTSG